MSTSRTIRLFVSSTFSDLKAERDALQREVFPHLRQLCLSKGLRFQAIDLRWGVSEEAGRHNRTMRICLRELARCQHGTPKPNFLVLLGDRYGWRPLPETVPADLFERLRPLMKAEGPQAVAALKWYKRDDNAVPAEYVLLPREGAVAEHGAWCEDVEHPLLAAMQKAAARLLADDSLSRRDRTILETTIGLSATHREILHGALAVKDARDHVHAFVRTIRYAPPQTPDKGFVDRLPDGREDADSKERLTDLREELQDHLGKDNIHPYAMDWREQGEFTDADLEQFTKDVYAALEEIILAQINTLKTTAPEEQEEQAHRDFAAERRDGFLGQAEPLRRIADYLAGEARRPLAVFGVAGSGKSALMAKAVEDFHQRNSGEAVFVIERYIGATPGSSDIISLLRNVVGAIRGQYPLPAPENPQEKTPRDDEIPFELNSLTVALENALGRATADRPVVVFLDALDQLSETQGVHQLHWFPAELPPHARLVVSTALPGKDDPQRAEICRALEAITSPQDRVTLDMLEQENGEKLLHRWLGLEHRTLQPAQSAAILKDFAQERNPLWLRTAATEATRLASWVKDIPPLPTDTPSLMRQVLYHLSAEENHGPMLVDRAMSYLACARHGLAEDEMLDILSQDAAVMADVVRRSPIERKKGVEDQIKSLPAAVWVSLRGDIERYLGEHEAQGAVLMRFYHRSFREAVQATFLSDPVKRQQRHAHLAVCFRGQDTAPCDSTGGARSRVLSEALPVARRAAELPWHLYHSNRISELEAILTDLSFVSSKVSVGMVFDLVCDYQRWRELAPLSLPLILTAASNAEGHTIGCPACSITLRISPVLLGEIVSCPACRAVLRVNPFAVLTEHVIRPAQEVHTTAADEMIQPGNRKVLAFGRFLRRNVHVLARHPESTVELATMEPPNSAPARAADHLITASPEVPHLRLIRPRSEQPHCAMTFLGHRSAATGVAWSPDGRFLVTASGDCVKFWEFPTGREMRADAGPTSLPSAKAAWSRSGRMVAVAWSDMEAKQGEIRLYDGRPPFRLRTAQKSPLGILAVAFDHWADRFYTVEGEGQIAAWRCEPVVRVAMIRHHREAPVACTVVPGNRWLAVADRSGCLTLYETDTLRPSRHGMITGYDGIFPSLNCCEASPYGLGLFAGAWGCTLHAWDMDARSQPEVIGRFSNGVSDCKFSPDGALMACATVDGWLHVLDVRHEGTHHAIPAQRHGTRIVAVAWHPTGCGLITASTNKTVNYWEINP